MDRSYAGAGRQRKQSRSRSRSRSRSPEISRQSRGSRDDIRDDRGRRSIASASASSSSAAPRRELDRERLDRERRERMSRLRAENEEEEQKLAAVSNGDGGDGSGNGNEITGKNQILEVDEEDLEGMDEEEQMRKLLGFEGFDSTKGKAVADNQTTLARGSAAKNKARKYRQYMNRKGGFNRPLDKMN